MFYTKFFITTLQNFRKKVLTNAKSYGIIITEKRKEVNNNDNQQKVQRRRKRRN